jgi:tetratricopeptide (TPR) repeat protein
MCARHFAGFLIFSFVATASPAFADDELDTAAKAIDASPDDFHVYEAYGIMALNKSKFDLAIAKLKIGVARIPEFKNGYYLLAYAARKKEAWADAADYYRRCIEIKQKENESYFGLGMSLAGLGDKKGAIGAFKKYVAQEKRPNMQRFIDEANLQLAKLEPSANPPAAVADAGSLRAAADALRNDKKFDEAAVAYRKAIEADKNNLDLYNDLGNVYFALKRYNDAAAAFKDAVGKDPSYALGWYNLGHALRKGDRKGEAVDAIRHYIKLKPEDPDPYYGLGQTLKLLGDVPGAIAAFHKYVDMEKRPDEQKWVEKARVELGAMEASQKPAVSPVSSGKVTDEKSTLDWAPVDSHDEGNEPHHLRGLRDLHDPFESNPAPAPSTGGPLEHDGLIDPFMKHQPEPSIAPSLSPEPVSPVGTGRVREYGKAISAYRRALAQHAEEVNVRYERGVQSALAGRSREAVAAWNTIALDDTRVVAARRSIEQLRKNVAQ